MLMRSSPLLALCLTALVGCSGTGLSPNLSSAPGGAPAVVGPLTPQFGVNLADSVGAAGTGKGFSHAYCNGGPGNPSGCYSDVPGKRKFSDTASDTLDLMFGSQPNGYVTVKFKATSKIGIGSYVMSGETNETRQCCTNIGAHAQVVSSGWDDTLNVSSGTLKKGTPVTIGVQWVLNPQTKIACDSTKNSYGEVYLYSASITPPAGDTFFSISGGCVGSAFEYYLYNDTKQPGTTAVGTINTSVGASYPIGFAISGYAIACQPTNKCVGDIRAILDGYYKFSITSITPGATVTSASGYGYP